MENKRESFGRFIRAAILKNPGRVVDFAERAAKGVGRDDPEVYRKFVDAVLSGRKPLPPAHEAAWAKALGIRKNSREMDDFLDRAKAARAWGKADGQPYMERLEMENIALRADVARLTRDLETSERLRRALEDRLALLEAEELKPRNPGR